MVAHQPLKIFFRGNVCLKHLIIPTIPLDLWYSQETTSTYSTDKTCRSILYFKKYINPGVEFAINLHHYSTHKEKQIMKKLIAIALVAFLGLSTAMAQQTDLRRKISVSGTAETEVTPDIIYIGISLKEYLNGKKKVEITELEKQLYAAIQQAGIPKENLTISNLSSWNDQTSKKKNPDFLASKQYRLKVSDLNKFNAILEDLDAKGIANTNIESYDYSKIESLKKDLKIKALLSAKDKATYMVEALNGKLGSVLEIQDGGDNIIQPVYRNYMMKSAMAEMSADTAPEIDFKKIKLNFTVNVIFEIK